MAVVVENLTHNLPVGNNDPGIVHMQQRGGKQVDIGYLAVYPEKFDIFTDGKWLGNNDRQPRNQVGEDSLHGKADADPGHADSGDERRDLDPHLSQRHDPDEGYDQELDYLGDEVADRFVIGL